MTAPPQAAAVVAALLALDSSVGCAESLTGGLVCGALTEVPGASAVVRGGVVAYATELKAALLGVDATLLAARGPVDPQVARAMAAGAARACGATYGVATTGVAGPDRQGGAAVGTVYVAVAGPGVDRAESLALPGDRAAVRAGAVTAALDLLLAILPPPPGR